MPKPAPPAPTAADAGELCGATWWHAEEKGGQRTRVDHSCGKLRGEHHGMWHTCYLHGAPERMSTTAQRVTQRA